MARGLADQRQHNQSQVAVVENPACPASAAEAFRPASTAKTTEAASAGVEPLPGGVVVERLFRKMMSVMSQLSLQGPLDPFQICRNLRYI